MICVIQLDGLGAEPTQRLLDSGELPNLAAQLSDRPRRELSTPADRFPPAVYPTLYSGIAPAAHGLFYPFQWKPEKQRIVTTDHLAHPKTIWQSIGEAGGSSLIVDPYEALPDDAPAARIISGWQLSERVVLRRWSRPRSLWPRLAHHGLPPRATETFGEQRQPELDALAAALLRAGPRVADLAERELAKHAPDLAWLSFVAPHVGGHRLWESPELDQIYRSSDESLGRVLAALPPGTDPIIICPIGMGPDRARADLLPEMLARVLGEVDAGDEAGDDSGAMWRLRAAVPSGLRSAVARSIPAPLARGLTARLELRGVDWSRTRAFAHPSDNQGYVRFNLAGRERDGIVDPGEADALAAEITAGLTDFTGTEGEAVVEGVDRVEGEGAKAGLPDLVVRWAPPAQHSELGLVRSERFGEVRRHGAGSGRTGNHPADGAWVSGADQLPGFGPPAGAIELSAIAPALVAAAGCS